MVCGKITKKNINMKQLLSLFLFLLPCLAWAQYPSNGNQKITLGEQTTADGLIWRGVIGDTALITPLSDTSAYIILDTVNHRFYNYNRATNVWSVAGGGTAVTTFSAGTTGLTPSTATSGAVTLGGTLAVANGGTNTSTAFTAGSVVFAGSGGTYTQANEDIRFITADKRLVLGPNTILSPETPAFNGVRFKSMGKIQIARSDEDTRFISIDNEGGEAKMDFGGPSDGYGTFKFTQSNNVDTRTILHITGGGNFGVSENTAGNITEKLTVTGNARITAVGAGAYANDLNITSTGVLTTASSDEKYKYNILPINYGLNTILQLNPVNFQWIKGEENDLGFIAQDVAEIIPEAVDTNWNSDLLFRYESLIPILTKAIQEQQALIKALEQRIINLENK
jgi:hypothetical protein